MAKVYRVHCYGFTGTFATAPEAQNFIDGLRTKGCVGQTIEVAVGQGTVACATYDLKNTRRDILKAA